MHHPHLTELYNIYQSETQPFRKVHRMIDLFESLIKMHTVVIIAEYVGYNKLSDAAKGMLAQGLRTPSLGTWQLFSRILFEELQEDGYHWTFSEFSEDFAKLDKALNASKTNVIAFRNGYAHGATPTDEQCSSDISQYEPFLLQLMQSQWLQSTYTQHRDQKVWIRSDSGQLCLHPILLFKEEAGASPYAFFNDLKNDKVGLLNYPLSKHYREKDFYNEFHQYFPLQEWKKTGNNEFYQRIEELTETFKGRSIEREKLLNFVIEKNKGYLSIQGNPGIGKSALIAQFFKDLKSRKEIQHFHIVEYFIRRGTAQAQIEYLFNYLIRRTDELFAEGREIRAEGKAVWELQQQLFSKWRLWGEKGNGSKMLFLIDGLDEGVENNLVAYLPRENFDNILIIYGSRPGGHKSIDDLWAQLPAEHHEKIELSGLSKTDIRALIYEVANKYELEKESEWVDAVQHRSQGNPLYLKLLCDAIELGSITLNDIHALPEKIDEYYKAILDRYAADTKDGDGLLSALFTFAAAKDYLTISHLGLINKMGDAALQRIGSTLKEVLYENPLTEEVLDYQLFHESFREYLVKEKLKQVNDAAERIIDFCSQWKEFDGTWEQRYALQHYSTHLFESKKELRAEQLMRLIYDKEYVEVQQKSLRQFDSSNALYRHALKKAGDLKREEDMLEAALCLVDLKYAEANDAPQVVAMVASGDIDHALKRIEKFGGPDEEGMKRKFTLYMLCLMELALLDSKDMPFRKTAIEKLVNHLDENIPVDYSVLNWNEFFPSYIIFKLSCEMQIIGVNYMKIYERTNDWDAKWVSQNGAYSKIEFDILLKTTKIIKDDLQNISALNQLAIALYNQNYELESEKLVLESLDLARSILSLHEKSKALSQISSTLYIQKKYEEASRVIEESLDVARGLSDKFKVWALSSISTEYRNQNSKHISQKIMAESISFANQISISENRNFAFYSICREFIKQGKLGRSIQILGNITHHMFQLFVHEDVAIKLSESGKIKESIIKANCISDSFNKNNALVGIALNLMGKGKIKDCLSIVESIQEDWHRVNAFRIIAGKYFELQNIKESVIYLYKALEKKCGLGDNKNILIHDLSVEFLKKKKNIDKALVITNNGDLKSFSIRQISIEMARQGDIEKALNILKSIEDDESNFSDLYSALSEISTVLFVKGKIFEAGNILRDVINRASVMKDEWYRNYVFREVSTELAKQDNLDYSLQIVQKMEKDWQQSYAIGDISEILVKKKKITEAIQIVKMIPDNDCRFIRPMIIELANNQYFDEALSLVDQLSDNGSKIYLLSSISTILKNNSQNIHAKKIMSQAINIATSENSEKDIGLSKIVLELSKQEEWSILDNYIKEITSINAQQECWKSIGIYNSSKNNLSIDFFNLIHYNRYMAQVCFIKGYISLLGVKNIDNKSICDFLQFTSIDTDSLEYCLQIYSQFEIFFGNSSKKKIDRLNKTLNIQWALDIVSKFPKNEIVERLSTTLSDWDNEIKDEDDREEIELLARKVAKGKMTEEEFGNRLRDIL